MKDFITEFSAIFTEDMKVSMTIQVNPIIVFFNFVSNDVTLGLSSKSILNNLNQSVNFTAF